MLILNFRLTRAKKLLLSFVIAAAAISVCAGAAVLGSHPADTATCDELGEYSLKAENDAQAKEFLRRLGVRGEIRKAGEETVKIPLRFNKVYEDYNDLQKRIGLDLNRVKGKNALKLTYHIQSKKADCAVLLLCGGRIAGGHFTSSEYGRAYLPLA